MYLRTFKKFIGIWAYILINKGNEAFQGARNSEYVDKSGLIAVVNSTLNTEYRFSCVTRCRRFGKSMAAKMLCAYYDRSCDSRELFRGLEIEKDPSFERHLNKYSVIYIDITDFTTRYRNDCNIVNYIQKEIKHIDQPTTSGMKTHEKRGATIMWRP